MHSEKPPSIFFLFFSKQFLDNYAGDSQFRHMQIKYKKIVTSINAA